LLRPLPARRAGLALLLVVACGIAAPAAVAGGPAPDPSPHTAGAGGPDPYPATRTPSAPAAPAVTRVVVQTVPAPVAPTRAVPAKRRERPKAVVRTTTEPLRAPDHPAPRVAALARATIDAPARVSLTRTLALGLLVLISASLVAGAARELAR
jgi:hypothetical protein